MIKSRMDVSFLKLERQENEEWFITGRVTDRESGNAIPGVNVLIAESRDVNLFKPPKENPALHAGTATDREGYFEIRSADNQARRRYYFQVYWIPRLSLHH